MTPMEGQDGPRGEPSFLANLAGLARHHYREEREAWRRHYRKFFKHGARALGLGFVLGFVYFMVWPDQEKKALEFVARALKDIRLEGSPLALALTVFYHNARASVIAVAAGLVPFLFLPILDPVLNGGVLGLLVSITKHQGLDVPRIVLTQILPHGVFELTAVLYATSVGLYLSSHLGRRALAAWNQRAAKLRPAPSSPSAPSVLPETCGGRPAGGSESLARNVIRSFVLVVLPLLFIAAFIEGFITPLLH